MRIDFHQHVWTDDLRRALERRSEPPYLRGRVLTLARGSSEVDPGSYSPEARLAELDRHGLDGAVVSLPPTLEPGPELVEPWNDMARELLTASGGRLIPLAYRASRPGFLGAILAAPELLDLVSVAPLLARLEQAGQVLFVHPGPSRIGRRGRWWEPGVDYPAQMQAAYAAWIGEGAARWPGLRVVFALLAGGAPFQIERLVRRGLDPRAPFAANVWLETSSYGGRAIELCLQTFGAGRLLFGSDAPIDRVEDALGAFGGFGGALETEVLAANPLALLTPRRWAA